MSADFPPDPALYAPAMALAIEEAALGAAAGEVPAGCVIYRTRDDGTTEILARAHNVTEGANDATAHAERRAIAMAAKTLGDWRLVGTVLVCTKEPCAMCAGAIVLARVPTVVWGVSDPNRGGESVFHILTHPNLIHRAVCVPGVEEERCREQLRSFFRARRTEAGK